MTTQNNFQNISSDNFQNLLLNEQRPILASFFSKSSIPCNLAFPVLEEVAMQMSEKVLFAKIDIDENQEIAKKYQVEFVPSCVVFKNGEEQQKIIGLRNSDELIDAISENLN